MKTDITQKLLLLVIPLLYLQTIECQDDQRLYTSIGHIQLYPAAVYKPLAFAQRTKETVKNKIISSLESYENYLLAEEYVKLHYRRNQQEDDNLFDSFLHLIFYNFLAQDN